MLFSFIILSCQWITNAGIFFCLFIEKKKLLQFNVFTLMEFDLYKVLTNVK